MKNDNPSYESKCFSCNLFLNQCKCPWNAVRSLRMVISFACKRIEKLESDFYKIGVEERLHSLEKIVPDACEQIEDLQNIGIEEKLHYLQNYIYDSLESITEKVYFKFDEIERKLKESAKTPHKCPVCDGIGKGVIGELRGLPIKTEKCHTCEGAGIVWG